MPKELEQTGRVHVPPSGEVVWVYYQRPFLTPPHSVRFVYSTAVPFTLVDQTERGFSIKAPSKYNSSNPYSWSAMGFPAPIGPLRQALKAVKSPWGMAASVLSAVAAIVGITVKWSEFVGVLENWFGWLSKLGS
jgi:hypothetical protein